MENQTVKRHLRINLKQKFAIIFTVFTVLLLAVAAAISFAFFKTSMDNYYKNSAISLSATQAALVDREALKAVAARVDGIFEEYVSENGMPDLENGSEETLNAYFSLFDDVAGMPEYQSVMESLRSIYSKNTVASCYFGDIDIDRNVGIYIADCDLEPDQCPVGYFDYLDVEQAEKIKNGSHDLDAYITNLPEYGWLVSAASSVFDDDDGFLIQSYIDISMNRVVAERQEYLANLIVSLLVVAGIVMLVTLGYIGRSMVRPIRSLDSAAANFVSDKESHGREGESDISRLVVRTGDEVEDLTGSVKKMEKEINEYIENITDITARQERMAAELNVAARIQADMLPSDFPETERYSVFALMDPAKEVGGDFYDFFMVDERHLAIVAADVSGKGVPSALFMVIGKTLIKNQTMLENDLGTVFTVVNNLLCEANRENLFITAFEAVLDLDTGLLTCVNAGHEPPFIYDSGADVFSSRKVKSGFVLAGMEDMKYSAFTFQMKPGDKFFEYTDGVTEATDANSRLFGMDRLERALKKARKDKPEEIINTVRNDIDGFVGDTEQFDDITMICVEYKGPGA